MVSSSGLVTGFDDADVRIITAYCAAENGRMLADKDVQAAITQLNGASSPSLEQIAGSLASTDPFKPLLQWSGVIHEITMMRAEMSSHAGYAYRDGNPLLCNLLYEIVGVFDGVRHDYHAYADSVTLFYSGLADAAESLAGERQVGVDDVVGKLALRDEIFRWGFPSKAEDARYYQIQFSFVEGYFSMPSRLAAISMKSDELPDFGLEEKVMTAKVSGVQKFFPVMKCYIGLELERIYQGRAVEPGAA